MQAALSDGDTDDLIYFAFDLLFEDGEDLRPLPLIERKERLRAFLSKHARSKTSPLRYVEHFDADGEQVMESARNAGLEGIISKQADAAYRSGRSGGWLKIKSRPGHEVVIGAWTSTNGKFSSLMVGVNKDDHLAYTGNVGTGYGAETVKRHHAGAEGRRRIEKPVRRQECAEGRPRHSLAEARARRRDRVRGLDP